MTDKQKVLKTDSQGKVDLRVLGCPVSKLYIAEVGDDYSITLTPATVIAANAVEMKRVRSRP